MVDGPEIASLLNVSARLGRDPLLVQAGTGNTSVKVGGVLWIKASGKWLAHACEDEILIPVDVEETRRRVRQGQDPAGQYVLPGKSLRTSVETAMHAVLPHRVVLHVHSVNTIAWAVRRDAQLRLAERLQGLHWKLIPYVPSGLPLAREIEMALASAPETNVLVLANHGLVVCGDDCHSAEALLDEVEARIAIEPRRPPEPDCRFLSQMVNGSGYRLPVDPAVHGLGTDSLSRSIVSRGVLYPCQAIFLAPSITVSPRSEAPCGSSGAGPFLIVEDAGVLVKQEMTSTARATLNGLAEVLQRIDADAQVCYLKDRDVDGILSVDAYRYRELVETSSGSRRVFAS